MNLRLFVLLLSYIIFYGSSSTSEDLMWESKSDGGVEGMNVVSASGFIFCRPFRPRTRTCVNSLPDVIKRMEPVESRAGVLSTRWYSPPFCFLSPLKSHRTFTRALKPLSRTEQIHFSTLSCLSQIKIYLHFRALYEIWQIAHSEFPEERHAPELSLREFRLHLFHSCDWKSIMSGTRAIRESKKKLVCI